MKWDGLRVDSGFSAQVFRSDHRHHLVNFGTDNFCINFIFVLKLFRSECVDDVLQVNNVIATYFGLSHDQF